MESIVIGTAGHIDHGKTALVKALTGRDTDTLEEEKRRGITINLGFAYFALPCGKLAGIVDVPGHERFIKNMLAGSTGIDIAMVVIAANEGVMPQTREHIDILSFLNIRHNLVILTKIDMVDEDFKQLVLDDTREYLENTFLKNAPIIQVDSLSGRGIGDVVHAIDKLAKNTKDRTAGKKTRLSVDRVFSVTGFGTVATGTLSDGKISVGDELSIYPRGVLTKVRNLQVHEQNVETAVSGQRVAVNLQGITTDQIKRGCVLAQKGSVYASRVLDVHFSLIESTKLSVKKMDKLKLYIGSKELVVRINPLAVKQVEAGEGAYAQILLEQDAVVRRGDSFVLRTISPAQTIGGGRIIDPAVPRYRKIGADLLDTIKAKDIGTNAEQLEAFVKHHPLQKIEQLQTLMNVGSMKALNQLLSDGIVLDIDGHYIHTKHFAAISEEIAKLLKDYHAEHSLRFGMPKAELQSRQRAVPSEREFDLAMTELLRRGKLEASDGLVALAGFSPALSSEEEKIRSELEVQVKAARFVLLQVSELADNPQKRKVLETMLKSSLLLLGGKYVIGRELYETAKNAAVELSRQHGAIKVTDFRDYLEINRKISIIILEHFDTERFTRRVGDDRVLLKK